MGTTIVAAALVATDEGDRLVLANVGDSRAYRLHSGELVQLTTDHSVAEELVARGELSEEEAAVHPHRHILTRALGVQPEVAVDMWQLVPEEGDRFLLCSDGVTNEVPAALITEVLTETRDPSQAAEILVNMANEAGGNDNATVVVLDVMVGEPSSAVDGPQATGAAVSGSAPGEAGAPETAAAVTATASSGDTMVVSAPESPPRRAEPAEAGAVTTNGVGAAVVSRTAPDTRLAPPPSRRLDPRTGARIPRRVTFRVLLFLIVLGGLVYGGYATIRWYVDSSYFVGLSHGQVVIYQGRPGGFVGINPKIVKQTKMTVDQVPSYRVADLETGVQESSYKAAQGYVTSLLQSVCSLEQPPAYCSIVTTPTAPGATTTTLPTSTPATFGLPAPRSRGGVHAGEAA